MKKLQLHFHPDKLARILGRSPSEEEAIIATSVMQILNGLVAPDGSQKDVMKSLQDVEQMRDRLLNDGSTTGEQDTTKEVRDLLARLSVKS